MSDNALFLIYLTGMVPGFTLRYLRRWKLRYCALAAGGWTAGLLFVIALSQGDNLLTQTGAWAGMGLWLAFWFGAVAGVAGAAIALWRE